MKRCRRFLPDRKLHDGKCLEPTWSGMWLHWMLARHMFRSETQRSSDWQCRLRIRRLCLNPESLGHLCASNISSYIPKTCIKDGDLLTIYLPPGPVKDQQSRIREHDVWKASCLCWIISQMLSCGRFCHTELWDTCFISLDSDQITDNSKLAHIQKFIIFALLNGCEG